jgi:hypothetical protein
MVDTQHRVCPVEKAGILDSRLRRWLQNPRKIVSPYIQEGMTVLAFHMMARHCHLSSRLDSFPSTKCHFDPSRRR